MKIRYDPDADVLFFIIKEEPPVDAIEEKGGIIISYNEKGEVVSVEIINASIKGLVKSEEITITFQKVQAA